MSLARMCRIVVIAASVSLALGLSASAAHAKPTVDVAFVLDTTGSMAGLIEGAKRKIWAIATSILDQNPDAEIRIGLVAYRDIGDDYVTRKFDLTTDIQDLYANLLQVKAQGGGDWPESVNEALDVAINKLQWSKSDDSRRIVFLVGDAPPHMDYAQDTKYEITLKVAQQKNIIVNAVLTGGARDTERVWRDVAQRGDGRFMAIPQDGGQVVIIETPYDEEIIILQNEINKTVIPYGPRALQKRTEDKARQLSEVARAAPASASDMASYINKRAKVSSEAVTGGGDLVSDVASGGRTLEGIKIDELPEALRTMSMQDRTAELDKQMALRKQLNTKLAVLVAKRDAYVAAQRDKTTTPKVSSFDREVEATLKLQLKK